MENELNEVKELNDLNDVLDKLKDSNLDDKTKKILLEVVKRRIFELRSIIGKINNDIETFKHQ